MTWFRDLDEQTLPFRRILAKALAPDPSTLKYPLFSTRLYDRRHRWQVEGRPNPYSAVRTKPDGHSFMRSLGYAVPEVYGIYPSLDAIPSFDDLPKSFVLKPTDGWSSAGIFLMHDGIEIVRKRRFTRDELISAARSTSGSGKEGIAGSWMAEELLFDFHEKGAAARDHKFFCFGSKVVLIMVIRRTGLAKPKREFWLRTPEWRPFHLRISWNAPIERSPVPKPPYLDEMLRIVSDVGGRLNIFLRIDMFATDRGPVFGEFTAYPNLGRAYTPRGDAWLGSHWTTLDGGAELPDRPQATVR